MPAKDDFEPFVLPGQRLCLDLDWCEKAPQDGAVVEKVEGSEQLEYVNMATWWCGFLARLQDANSLCSHWCTYHLFTSTSRVQNSETTPAPLYVDNLPGKSWFTFRLDVLLLSWCWGCYYIPLFFDLIFFSFVDSILAMYLWLFVRIWSVPLPSTRAWLRHVTAKMSVWAPFVVCMHADVGHTRLSFHTEKRSDLKAWIIFLKHP